MNKSKTETLIKGELAYPLTNDYLHNLIAYAHALGTSGLESPQVFRKHAIVCKEIDKELGIDAE